MAYIVIHAVGAPPQRLKLDGPIAVGRSLESDVWMEDPNISRHHCRIEPRDGHWVIIDLNSRNGTFVSGHRIQVHALRDADEILAGASRIVFHEGQYIANRPANPLEESAIRPSPSAADRPTMSGSTLAGRGSPGPRARKGHARASHPQAGAMPDARDRARRVSLPFSRPPARPIIKQDAAAGSPDQHWPDHAQPWYRSLLSRFRRR